MPEPGHLPDKLACLRARWGVGTTNCKISLQRAENRTRAPQRKSTETDPERTRAMQFTERELERAKI